MEVPSRKELDWPNAERRRDIEAAITAKQQPARTVQQRISVEPWSGLLGGTWRADGRTADPHRRSIPRRGEIRMMVERDGDRDRSRSLESSTGLPECHRPRPLIRRCRGHISARLDAGRCSCGMVGEPIFVWLCWRGGDQARFHHGGVSPRAWVGCLFLRRRPDGRPRIAKRAVVAAQKAQIGWAATPGPVRGGVIDRAPKCSATVAAQQG